MQRYLNRFFVVVGAALIVSGAIARAQQTTTTETRKFSVVSVDGNKVVIKEASGSREITVPPDFRMTVDGKEVTVAELKPGMNGTAIITKTTTVTPVFVTEVKDGLVAQTSGNSILVRVGSEYRRFSQGDLKKRNITIMKGGSPVELSDLRVNDRLTATIVTEGPPQVMTQQQVEATLSSPAAAATAKPSAGAAGAAPGAGAASAPPSAGTTPKTLPKTASSLPLIGFTGAVSLGVALVLTAVRRRRAGR
jgi:hypothetical protein